MDDITKILLENGLLGVVLAWAFWWIRAQNLEAKKERQELQDRLFQVIAQTNQFDAKTGEILSSIERKLDEFLR
jgi:hypothetical protein|tara:strand:+ start:837 stop:1058 length:222 start_codon:yes stop_codon:yes gene_type:complete